MMTVLQRSVFWKDRSEWWNWSTFTKIKEGRRKWLMCFDLQSAAFKKSKTAREKIYNLTCKYDASALRWEVSRDQLFSKRCLIQRQMTNSWIQSPKWEKLHTGGEQNWGSTMAYPEAHKRLLVWKTFSLRMRVLQTKFLNVIHIDLEPTAVSEIESKKFNVIYPFKPLFIMNWKSQSPLGQVRLMAFARADGDLPVAAPEIHVPECFLEILSALIPSIPKSIDKDVIKI